MQREWRLAPSIEPSPELRHIVGGHPLVASLLAQRGYSDPDKALAFLDPKHYSPAQPDALLGIAGAAKILHEAVQQGQNILVWGDFDVDGQTSTALLVSGLLALCEPEQIRYHVPNRFTESHGIKPEFLQKWIDDPHWQPQILLTCDTGIAEAAAVELAKEAGWTVVITDHHDLTAEFEGLAPGVDPIWGMNPLEFAEPSVRIADAIVNPKFQPIDDPLRTLPGVGVAFKLIQQLYFYAGITERETNLLDLVALGIVADVAEQVHDARYLLQLGLRTLGRTQRTGLLALMEVARVSPGQVSTDDIGFQIGPRMNALGRLEDATVSVELLTTDDPIRAGQLAAMMERLNQQRRLLTTQMTSAAFEMIDRRPDLLDYKALVLNHPAWHAGIVGIVASRLVDEFNRPVVLMLNPTGEPARGSARSIPGVDIGASIAGCAHLLIGHGGHPGAAGLSLLPENIDAFRRELDRQIELNRTDDGPPTLHIDAELEIANIDLNLAEEIQRIAPFGNGNPTPNFVSRNLRIVSDKRIGREGNHRKFSIQQEDNGPTLSVLWFNSGDAELPVGSIDLVYSISINEFRGERTTQLMYVDSRVRQQEQDSVFAATGPAIQIHDMRRARSGHDTHVAFADALTMIPEPSQAIWYAEGTNLPDEIPYGPRHQIAMHCDGSQLSLERRDTLVLWTSPPSAEALNWLVETVSPSRLYLVGLTQIDDSLDGVLRNVAGMCKYVLNRQKQISLINAASRIGTTIGVIRRSLRWLECKGLITLDEWITDDIVRIDQGVPDLQLPRAERQILQSELEEELAEVRAYRRYFQRATVNELGIG